MPDHAHAQLPLSRKRKERDGDGPTEPSRAEPLAAGNRLLAGYLAHEFLTKGTLLGQRFEPRKDPSPKDASGPLSAYADVAVLLKTDGAHVPGVVNPTHLARWLQAPLSPAQEYTRGWP